MSKQREALKLALGALDAIQDFGYNKRRQEIIQLVSEALAEPARKPLTGEEIDNLELPPNGCTMRELVRAIERAHGIRGE